MEGPVARPAGPLAVAEPKFHLSDATPEGRLYTDPAVLQEELDRFFYRRWLVLGRRSELPREGDYLTRRIGRENILLVNRGGDQIGGFYNVCRHRGTCVVPEDHGSGARSFACPYHSWTYGLDGRLVGAPHMGESVTFDRSKHGLWPIRVESWGGFLWGNLEPWGRALVDEVGPFLRKFDRYPFDELDARGRHEYEVAANWKLIVENFSECYHCAPVHPTLNRITPYSTGANDAYFHMPGGAYFAGGWMEFANGYTSMTRTGHTARPPLPGATEVDRGRVYYYVVFPNLFFSLFPDYLMLHQVWPLSPTRSRVTNDFYFARETALRPGFDPSDALDVWDEINRQDWAVCEGAQEGVSSRAWRGGRYSERESLVADFDRLVQDLLRAPRT